MLGCYFCHSKNIKEFLDLGQQPVSNRFLHAKGELEDTYPLVMNQCRDCGLIQVNDPVPAEELRPAYDWITYNEPEGHLDRLVEIIKNLPGVTSESSFCGISFKDNSTLIRLQKSGFPKTRCLDPRDDLNIAQKGAGVETIQAHLAPELASKIAQKLGKFDVIIVRHILEHAHDIAGFIRALKNLTRKDGYIVFEVPDCSRALDTCDYTTIWEEHTLYFTPVTLKNALSLAGFKLERYECYPYPFENSLVEIVLAQEDVKPSRPSLEILDRELARAGRFASHLPKRAQALQEYLGEYRKKQGKIALFGAGHLACTFVSALGLKEFIDFFVDDNPHKRGLFMPGCRLPIYESTALYSENVKLCLLSLNPLSEEKILETHKGWRGTFSSIFPSSSIALRVPGSLERDNSYADQRIQ
ncbi:MAG: methyltransferase domain-containing protein [Candidatus Omnitrophica bacterium]|nr:methyltransferase domain-containing protein [Candidatus Omnitrophota bacterium]